MRISDWSSDVCSSDLARYLAERAGRGDQRGERGAEDARRQPFDSAICGRLAERQQRRGNAPRRNRDEPDGRAKAQCERRERRGGSGAPGATGIRRAAFGGPSSDERRVGKEWGSTGRTRGSAYHYKKNKQ